MGRRRVPQVAYETCRKLSLRDMMIHWELPKKKRSIRRTRKPIGIQPNSITNKHALLSVWGKTKSRSFRCFRGRYGNGEQLALTIESALTIYNTRMSDPEAVTGDAIHSSSSFSAAADAEPSCPPAPARSTRISTIYTPCPALVANREAAQQAHFFLPYFDTFASMCNNKQAEQYGFEDLGCGHEAAATYRMQGQSFTSLLTSSNTELLWRQQILRGQQQEREDDHPQANDSGYYCASAEFELSRPVTGAERASGGVSGEPQAPVTPEKKQQPKKAAAATGRTGGRKRPLKDNKVPHSPSTPVAISSNLSFNLPEKNLFDLNELPDPKGRPRKHRPRVAKDKPPKTPRKRGRPRKKQHQEDDPAQQQQQQQQQQAETIEIFVSSYVRNSSNARMEWELSHGVQGHFIEANKRKGNGSSLESQRKRAKADSALSGLQSQPQPKRGYDLLNSDAQQGLNDELVYLMEKLIEGMKKMQLDSEVGLEIVEYKGFSGPVVPFIPPKKKKPRAKVVLDMETNRMWNLLMIKGAKQEEHVDQDAAKRWQRDRLMMGQRADLFISRMHLVQGDRRFSKWKGSVVDSVVGAFLTQNVSDHLSSSAFMAVASRFPINKDPSNSRNGGCIPQNCGHCLGTSTPKKEEARIKVQARIKKRRNSHGLVQEEDNLYKQEGVPDSGLKVKRALFAEEEVSPSKEKVSTEDQVFIQETRSDVCSVVEMGSHIKSYAVQIEDLNSTCIFQESCNGGLTKVDNVDNAGGGTEERPCTGIPCSCQDKQSLTTNGAGNLNMKGSQTVASEMPERLNGKVKPSGIDLANLEHSQGTSKNSYKWDTLRSKVLKNQDYNQNEFFKTPTSLPPDSLDWEAVRLADVKEVADVIKERGMNNILAGRIKAFLERVHEEHGTINLEWLREIPPEDAKEFLLSIRGLGLKSVECIRLLTLEHLAFPVDTNVGRICVRLGWVPIEPLPEELQLHLLELYPVQATIQKYLWPRLCTLDQRTLYELHYQMITFGKVFCTKSKPNCNACPMRQDCKHFASAFASARLALPAPPQQNGVQEEESSSRLALAESVVPLQTANANGRCEPASSSSQAETVIRLQNVSASEANERCEPIIEEPSTPEPCCSECPDIEDYPPCLLEDDSILKINLTDVGETDKEEVPAAGQRSKALVLVPPEFAYIPVPKLKYEGRLRTVHYVYELPDNHPLLHEMDARETDDPCFYLLAIWSPEEELEAPPTLSECDYSTFTEGKESNEETIKGTLLVPCRSAMRGSFPLNGTYFQVNEVFADQATSLQPMDVPRASLWNLRRRFVYFGTSVTSIFRGLTTEEIQACFWRGYVCVRGFDRRTRAPRPLAVRFHLPASKKVAVAKKSGN